MNGRVAQLASRYAGRPVLMTGTAALQLAQRIRTVDGEAFERPGRLEALFRKVRNSLASGARAPEGPVEDDEPRSLAEATEADRMRLAYAPFYAGAPEDYGFCWTLNQGVGLMCINGPIAAEGGWFCGEFFPGYDTIIEAFQQMVSDDRVKAIFVRALSPGGVVAGGLQELAAYIRANRESAGGKPIWFFADLAASAMYWIAAQGDHIVAPSVGLVGCVGAMIVHEDYSGALEKAGIAITAVQRGAKKTDGAWWKALSPGAQADLQAEIEQIGRIFDTAVLAGRPSLTPEAVTATEAALFMAQHDDPERSGVALGLVDEIMGESEAFAALVAKVSNPVAHPSAATRGATAASPKETPMATTPAKPAAAKALAAAELAAIKANAEVARLKASAAAPAVAAPAKEPEEEDELADAVVPADDPENPDVDDVDDPEEVPAEPEVAASAIANSPLAAQHPAHALAAIKSGMSMAQFEASVAAAQASAPATGLRAQLAGGRRLAPDAIAATDPKVAGSGLDTRAIYARRNAPRAKAKTAR